ncbi:MAG: IPT/TIG domain-containing protein [Candidatus Sericytochromatia bacterium]
MRLELSIPSRFISNAGSTLQIQARRILANGQAETLEPSQLTWTSARPQDISVNDLGLLLGITANGYSEITVRLPGSELEARLLVSVADNSGSSSGGGGGGNTSPPPALNGISPASAAIGDTVTLSGNNLSQVSSVSVDGIAARFSAGRNGIQVEIPAGVLTGVISVRIGSQTLTENVTLSNRVWFVDDSASGSADGSSWNNAFVRLQDALAAASTQDQIWLAEGRYLPTDDLDRTVHFNIPAHFQLYGSFAASEHYLSERTATVRSAHESILSGDLLGDDLYEGLSYSNMSENSLNILRHGNQVLLDGLVIEGGFANTSLTFNSPRGAGIYSGNQQLTLQHSILRHNVSVDQGGAWYTIDAASSADDVVFSYNLGNGNGGGAIYNESGALSITASHFDYNQANGGGGAGIYNESGNLTIGETRFENNAANGGGGAGIRSSNGTLQITNSQFEANSAMGAGGSGIYTQSGNLMLSGVDMENNTHNLGAVNASGTSLSILNGRFENNTANAPGGAIYSSSTSLSIEGTRFIDNHTQSVGGALNLNSQNVSIHKAVFEENTSQSPGGAVYIGGATTVSIADTLFQDNSSISDGGALALLGQNASLENVAFMGNASTGSSGGGLSSSLNSLTLTDVIFQDNQAFNNGGGMNHTGGLLNIQNSAWIGNQAVNLGGGLYTNSGPNLLSNTLFHLNAATDGSNGIGGGLYNDSSSLSLIHATFGDNSAAVSGPALFSGGPLSVRNSIVWDSDNVSPLQITGSLVASYSVIRNLGNYTQDGSSTGNTDQDPLFVSTDADGNDNRLFSTDDGLRLGSASSALNRDDSGIVPILLDILGVGRNGLPDAGAYERR